VVWECCSQAGVNGQELQDNLEGLLMQHKREYLFSLFTPKKVLLVTFSQLMHFVDKTVKYLSFLGILTNTCINSMTASLFLIDIISV